MTAYRRMVMKALGGSAAALALALAAPALAQNSDAPVDVTAAPAPTTETVGPSQLRDFNLQGTVTRPSDRPATTAPTPVQSVPAPSASVTPSGGGESATTRPQSSQPQRTASRPAAGSAPTASNSAPIGESVATPSTPLDVTTEAAPAPAPGFAPETTPASPSLPAAADGLPWPWIAAILALIAGGAFIGWSRRGRRSRYADPGRMAFAGLAPEVAPEAAPAPQPRPGPRPDPVPPRAQPAPAPAPRPEPAPAPQPKKEDGLIVSTGLRPELAVQFQPDRAVVTENEVLVQFDVLLVNNGSAPARDVLVEGRMVCAHAGQDQEIAGFFQNPVGQGDRIASIPPLGRISLKSAVRMPIEQMHSFEAGGRRLFVPLVAFNILFRSNSGEDQASASFLVGRGSEQDEKLAPFRLDLGPRIFRGLSARPHSMGLKQVA